MRSGFAKGFENLVSVLFDVYLIEYLRDLAFLVDQKRCPLDTHVLFAVH